RARAVRDEMADAPEPDDPERLLVQLDARELRALPLAAGERHVRLREVAREREQQRHRVLGGGDDVRLGSVRDDDPTFGGRVDVEVLAQKIDARGADLLLDEHARALGRGCSVSTHEPSLSTAQSIHAVSACTSSGSTAGNMPMRSWLRPSLR